jgi:hypothetical protein
MALIAEAPAVVDAAEARLPSYLRAPRSLEANLAGPVVTVGARRGDIARHARYLELSEHAATPQERRRFRMALAEFRDAACIERTLALCLTDRIPTQDMALLLARTFENPAARTRAFEFVLSKWPKLRRRMPAMLIGRLIEAAPALQTEARRRTWMAFFKRNPVPTAERALRQANERFQLDAALRKRAAPRLARWLEQQAHAAKRL